MEQARLVRTVRFRARHHYRNPAWTVEENARRFGPQGTSHEHGWRVVVHVVGPLDADTGWCCDVPRLDAALARITEGWDGGDLNVAIPEVAAGDMRPSTENLARWIFGKLLDAGAVDEPAAVVRVEVHESDELGAVYPEG